jgi:hypothetical protein
MSQRELRFAAPPRGWSTPGWSASQRTIENLWDRVGGVYRIKEKEIIINNYTLASDLQYREQREKDILRTLPHEIGHAIGSGLGRKELKIGQIALSDRSRVQRHGLSSAPEFYASYMKDIALITGISNGEQVPGTDAASATSESPPQGQSWLFLPKWKG